MPACPRPSGREFAGNHRRRGLKSLEPGKRVPVEEFVGGKPGEQGAGRLRLVQAATAEKRVGVKSCAAHVLAWTGF